MPRKCACGCGEPLADRRPSARYATAACRTRAWKRRSQYVDQRARKTSRNANPRRLTPGQVRLSYPKALDTLVAEFKRVNMNDPERRARQVLDPLLTDRQREALRG
jgi:hypothetical protein